MNHSPAPGAFRRGLSLACAALVGGALLAVGLSRPVDAGGVDGPGLPLATTLDDFFQPGTQPHPDGIGFDSIIESMQCNLCHGNYDPVVEPMSTWSASMMGQSARDPVFMAWLTIANQDAVDGGHYCIRCHVPGAFLGGRSVPTDGSAFLPVDMEGVNCNFCHRLVDPVFTPGVSPPEDEMILANLNLDGLLPPEGSNSRFVVDPTDSRRGPFDDVPANVHLGVPQAQIIVSPFHQSSNLCFNCHDVSNPLFTRQPDGTFALNAMGAAHPTAKQEDMFPLHRVFSEWFNSYYNTVGGVQHNGRFGGNHINNPAFIANGTAGVMSTCQDCHMPDQLGFGTSLGAPFFERPDVPQHSFVGANTWVIDAVRALFPDLETGLSPESAAAMKARNTIMLEQASDLELTQDVDLLVARVINQCGHKLPTGFPDGRRVWINVQFFDVADALLAEHGAYDFATGTLLGTTDTTIFEVILGIDAAQAATTGLPEGPTQHFFLANQILKDNRIPPTGFTNIAARRSQTQPVAETYIDGQHWHDTPYPIPDGAARAVVTVYFQVTTREQIEFLRDENVTDGRGQVAFDQWVAQGMSAPVVMDMAELVLHPPADINGDGTVDVLDLLLLLSVWGDCPPPPIPCPPDLNHDGAIDVLDLLLLLAGWS